MGFVYDPEAQLPQIFPDEAALQNIDAVLDHVARYKQAAHVKLHDQLLQYKAPIDVATDVAELAANLARVRNDAQHTHASILEVTLQIQKLDTMKTNLVLSMNVLKRLQMLLKAYDSLCEVAQSHDYKEISAYLGAVRGLMEYFRPYKSIEEIAALYRRIHQTQKKLVDDVFIDFEDSFTNHFTNDQLCYGCEILETADAKYKDKLLTWFYNLQLKEIQSIFGASGEAGSLENVARRYMFFTNVLANIRSNYLHAFPPLWGVDMELSKLFCKMTHQEIAAKLSSGLVPAAVILDALTATLAFEKELNEAFKTTDFLRMVLALFEPYLITWVRDQDDSIRGKFMELHLRVKVPEEIASAQTFEELIHTLQVNNVPNFAESSSELFKIFQKSLGLTIKLSSGEILLELAHVFAKYLQEYHHSLLLPVLNSACEHPQGIEPIKYLTMLFNTADYVIKNTNDLQDRIHKLIDKPFKEQVTFDIERSLFFELISKAIRALVSKVSSDLSFSWRQFENNSWGSLEAVSDTSHYMEEFVDSLTQNHRVICPLIIREGYVRNYADKLVEAVVADFMSRLGLVKPLSIVAIEQILLDVSVLKNFFKSLLLFSDASFDIRKPPEDADAKVPKAYLRHLNSQFTKLELLLKLLLTPTLPIDNIVESYFSIIGDKSLQNFQTILGLKTIPLNEQPKYMENFKLQVLSRDSLVEESPIMSVFHEAAAQKESAHPSSQLRPPPVDIKALAISKSPEPHIPDFLKSNPAKMQALKLNNALKDFSLNGESHVNKFNENFKNFGKFFRKDGDTDAKP
ncbi:hypothetical protein METBIDRAFT_78111 [Metschnikowia bicuspidata var. bicuspidata NRRL YB-4993]|uniref:Vps53 N-terminal domain-containing protein n=1 Tax=Metschnikowia bicuspidata var. bicuspidata NRRL YB-4993 TaxID=869754 RepID=A0A1A0HA58_9ASCO|nr:hypothetical protein METBIDRAFT_78111 [Metschnikowia bicuspidata var. bicuspidata NRRL YB-4993]OBA21014.1 hypothetical protein METBIDRAFT_78111 [Metschnikowia bicuspidata var. bicuspidata NRRL YB-4993]